MRDLCCPLTRLGYFLGRTFTLGLVSFDEHAPRPVLLAHLLEPFPIFRLPMLVDLGVRSDANADMIPAILYVEDLVHSCNCVDSHTSKMRVTSQILEHDVSYPFLAQDFEPESFIESQGRISPVDAERNFLKSVLCQAVDHTLHQLRSEPPTAIPFEDGHSDLRRRFVNEPVSRAVFREETRPNSTD